MDVTTQENNEIPTRDKKTSWLFRSGLAIVLGLFFGLVIILLIPKIGHGNLDTTPVTVKSKQDMESVLAEIGSSKNGESHLCSEDSSGSSSCINTKVNNACAVGDELCDYDLNMGKIAWKYFENNFNPDTGLVNAVNNFKSTTMWDSGSALAATIAAYDFDFIDQKEFDDRIMALLKSLTTMELFNGEAPNKVYNTKTLKMVDYGNKEVPDGIGVSSLDLGRMMSWLNTLSCLHPKYRSMVQSALSRWDYKNIIIDGSMWSMARDKEDRHIKILQEGRLGYEQYAAKVFRSFGFDVNVAASYENEFRSNTEIMGVMIAYDNRDPRKWHANNYVVTESYTMDAMENGLDEENEELVRNIFEVQKRRWKETGIVTAISEDNINQSPWFLYNTIFNAGRPWQTTNSSDVQYDHLKSISTKAAISMALLYPEDEYSAVLMDAISSAYDPDLGWYSGIFEAGLGYNSVVTANTNGVILEGLLYKKYGPIIPHCTSCTEMAEIESDLLLKPEPVKEMTTDCQICEIVN